MSTETSIEDSILVTGGGGGTGPFYIPIYGDGDVTYKGDGLIGDAAGRA